MIQEKFTFKAAYLKAASCVSDTALRAKIINAIVEYGINGTMPSADEPEILRVVLELVAPQIAPRRRPKADAATAVETAAEATIETMDKEGAVKSFDEAVDDIMNCEPGDPIFERIESISARYGDGNYHRAFARLRHDLQLNGGLDRGYTWTQVLDLFESKINFIDYF